MGKAKLMKVSYYDSKAEVRLTTYADTVVYDPKANIIVAIRFGGYPEQVKAMADAMFGGGGFDIETEESRSRRMYSLSKQYQRKISHDGIYAEATLLVKDDELTAANADQEEIDKPKKTFIFCEQNNSKALFDELDHKTAVPLIPEFQDYFLDELKRHGILKQLRVISLSEKFDAWLLECFQNDDALIDIISTGLTSGAISIPGAVLSDVFDSVSTVSQYLNRFGTTVANRIKSLFQPLFDPATEQLSQEVLAVNAYFHKQTKLTLYDAQLAVAESVKRRLDCENVALIIAECGSGKTKIGSAGLHAHQQGKNPGGKTFNVVLCPSHVTRKWVREIEETLPNTFAIRISPMDTSRYSIPYQKRLWFSLGTHLIRMNFMKRI